MTFECQRNSYLKEFETEIKSLKENCQLKCKGGKVVQGLELILRDTIFFPEGGGQNDDRGEIDGYRVIRVTRKGTEAIHFLPIEKDEQLPPFEVAKTVQTQIDWNRRFDHMQQHTGQHLLSDILEYDTEIPSFPTTSWWMAESDQLSVGFSYIELQGETITKDQCEYVESKANQYIRQGSLVSVNSYDDINDPELTKATTRGLPDDLEGGPIRVVSVLGRGNMCCGTHVKNLAELQVIKILYAEKSKKKGRINLYFLVGNRVIRHMNDLISREKRLTELLQNNPRDHAQLVEKAIQSSKTLQKNIQILLRESASDVAKQISKMEPFPKFYCCYKKEGDITFINALINEINEVDNNILIFVVTGDDKLGPCQMTLNGQPEITSELGIKLIKILDGKGGGKGRRINAKVNSLKHWNEAIAIIENHFEH